MNANGTSYSERRNFRAKLARGLELSGVSPTSTSGKRFLRRKIPELRREARRKELEEAAAERRGKEKENNGKVDNGSRRESAPRKPDNRQRDAKTASFMEARRLSELQEMSGGQLCEIAGQLITGPRGELLRKDNQLVHERIRYFYQMGMRYDLLRGEREKLAEEILSAEMALGQSIGNNPQGAKSARARELEGMSDNVLFAIASDLMFSTHGILFRENVPKEVFERLNEIYAIGSSDWPANLRSAEKEELIAAIVEAESYNK